MIKSKIDLISLIILFSTIFSLYGQDYTVVAPDSTIHTIKIDSFNIIQTYSLEGFNYYVGYHKNEEKNDYRLRLYIFNPSDNLLFKSKGFADSHTFSLTFFKSDKTPNQTIILGHISNEYSWGNMVYLLANSTLEHIGTLDVATYDFFDEPWNISECTQIWTEQDKMRFTFSCDTLVYNPGGQKQQVLTKEQIEYQYQYGQLKTIIKHTEN